MSFHQEFFNKCTQALCVLMCRDGEALIIFHSYLAELISNSEICLNVTNSMRLNALNLSL